MDVCRTSLSSLNSTQDLNYFEHLLFSTSAGNQIDQLRNTVLDHRGHHLAVSRPDLVPLQPILHTTVLHTEHTSSVTNVIPLIYSAAENND